MRINNGCCCWVLAIWSRWGRRGECFEGDRDVRCGRDVGAVVTSDSGVHPPVVLKLTPTKIAPRSDFDNFIFLPQTDSILYRLMMYSYNIARRAHKIWPLSDNGLGGWILG